MPYTYPFLPTFNPYVQSTSILKNSIQPEVKTVFSPFFGQPTPPSNSTASLSFPLFPKGATARAQP